MRFFDHTGGTFCLLVTLFTLLCAVGCDDIPFPQDGVYGDPVAARSRLDLLAVDAHVAATPPVATGSLDELAAYISAVSTNESDRAYAVYRWIRDNIEVDYERASSATIDQGTQSPAEVLRTRRAVCSGFARIFERLVEMVGLNSVRIFGYGVMACRDLDASATGYKHVWNAVEIDGAWYLVDTSWAASPVLDGSDDPNFFFLTPPSSFVHRHLPHDSDWQLLDDPVSNGAFWGGLASCD